ncbi:MAG: 16S rRNA (guanine(966)-N(2))-methyltransferase RsmD [Deltaproteobacteria bacterium]|nr:16S rRNA (guanine(966)-N(2))-methyltransferase RsmD [Deltaproteobacteria bacterium]
MLRIIGGEFGGRRLKAPAGQLTRPSAARLREALFSILAGRLEGARVVDLFAGSGALGLEALSRGAASCVFVELRRPVVRVLHQNLAELGLTDRGRVLAADAAFASRRLMAQGPFDLALADPPYGQGLVARVARVAAHPGFLAPGGIFVVEHQPNERPTAPPPLVPLDHRVYGQSELSMFALPVGS